MKKWLLLFVLIILPGVLCGQVYKLSSQTSSYSFLPRYFWEDPSGDLTLEDIRNGQGISYYSPDGKHSLGYSDSAYWIKGSVRIEAGTMERWYLLIDHFLLDHIDVWFIDDLTGEQFYYDGGLYSSARESKMLLRGHLFPLPYDDNRTFQVYIRFQSRGALVFSLTWESEKDLVRDQTAQVASLAFLVGLVTVLSIYNLALFILLKRRLYLLHFSFNLFYFLTALFYSGISFGYFFPSMLSQDYLWILVSSVLFFLTALLVHFEVLKINHRQRMYWVGWSLMIPLIFSIILVIFQIHQAIIILHFFTIIGMLFLLALGLRGIVKRTPMARIMVLTFAPAFIANFVRFLSMAGFFQAPYNMDLFFQLGLQAQVLFLVLYQVYFLKQSEKEKDNALEETREQRLKAEENLKRGELVRDEFLSSASHELRTPLTAILGFADNILTNESSNLTDEQKEELGLIVSSGQKLANLINDILDYSKLSSKKIVLNRRPVNIRSLSHLVLRLCNPMITSGRVVFSTDIPRDIPLVQADSERLLQILHNLVSNAVKYTDEGTIMIRAFVDRQDSVQIEVIDTGIGIPPAEQDVLFEAFHKVRRKDKPLVGGNRLGLHVCKKLVELHGGTIGVDSTVGDGSRFFFSLPVSSDQDSDGDDEFIDETATSHLTFLSGESLNSNPSSKPLKRVLIVDDDPMNQRVLSRILQIEEFFVECLSNGLHVFDWIKEHGLPDLILLDIMMPEVSGTEICRRIRKKYPPAELPILLITAKDHPNALVDGFNAGASDYLSKPVNKGELLSRVNMHIQLKEHVNEEKQHREKLFQMDKLVTLGTIVSGVAHEINNPNNSIMNNSRILSSGMDEIYPLLEKTGQEDVSVMGYSLDEFQSTADDLFGGILRGSERIKKIVEDLKRYARQEVAKKRVITINDVIKDSLSLLKPIVRQHTDRFELYCTEERVNIFGISQRIEQVLVNLIQNACYALTDRDQFIILDVSASETHVFIKVVDEGRGMDETLQKRALSPFFTTRQDMGGTGLGLYIVTEIIQEHDGLLRLESTPGKGSTFEVSLPRAEIVGG